MANFFPKAIPANWYQYDAEFSFELLSSYIDILEDQVDSSIAAFNANKESFVDDSHGEEWANVVEMYKKLDDGTWDLKGIFEDYFPNLQRRAGLVTLYSFLEHELNKLCNQFVVSNKLSIELKDLKGDGIDRAILFLIKVAGLPFDKGKATWDEVVKIRKIRNLIVHNEAKLVNQEQAVTDYINHHPNLEDADGEVKILKGYLPFVLDKFKDLFTEIDSLIQKKIASKT